MANQDDQMKRLVDVMERQYAQGENTQKTLTMLLEAQQEQLKVQESQLEVQQSVKKDIELLLQHAEKQALLEKTQFEQLQKIRAAADISADKLGHMEWRQWLNSSEYKDSLRALHQFSQGTLWSLSSSQCKGIESALSVGASCYGDLVLQNDQRRAEHNVVQEHFKEALPEHELWQMGCVALRQPRVQQHLIAQGVAAHLLQRFHPDMVLLEKLRDASPMADTNGQPMTPQAIADWERKIQFDENRGKAAGGWTSVSQASEDQPMNEAAEESQMK